MPEDDGDTFRDIGVALGKSVVLLFVLTACAASAFQAIETPKELSRAMHARVKLAGMRAKYNITKSDYADIVDALSVPTPRCGRCNRADLDSKCTSKLKHCNWNWIGSFYFAFTIFTTIGYGTFTPATAGGKVLVVVIFFPGVIALGYGQRWYADQDATDDTDISLEYSDFSFLEIWAMATWAMNDHFSLDLIANYQPETHTEQTDDMALGFGSLRLVWRP